MKTFTLLLLVLLSFLSITSFADNEGEDFPEPTSADFDAIAQALKSPEGLKAEVHGPNVLIWRSKESFFVFSNLPMTGRNPAAKQAIAEARRHDKVTVHGEFDPFLPEGQRHIDVEDLKVTKKFEAGYPQLPPYQYKANVPEDLKDKKEVIVKLHAVTADASTLVVEYVDRIVPVVVPNPEIIKSMNLLRGDKLKVHFSLSPYPKEHPHVTLDKGPDAVKVLMAIHSVEQRDENEVTCGPLALFVESPAIQFNVFAMQVPIGDGYDWTYTLLNPEDSTIYKDQREKMQKIWDENTGTMIRGRNHYINPKIEVCAKGKGNDSSRIQANPQIFVMTADDIKLRVLP